MGRLEIFMSTDPEEGLVNGPLATEATTPGSVCKENSQGVN